MKELLNVINTTLQDKNISDTMRGMLVALKEEVELNISSKENNEYYLKKALNMAKSIKNVQLGCGKHIIDGYINIDILDTADIKWDVRKSLPFESNSIDKIFSEHFFEHIDYPVSANNLLDESYRVLKKNGEFIIGIPDCSLPISDIINNETKNMEIAKEKWYQNRFDVIESMNTNIDYLNYVMRDQLYHTKYHPHYWGYTKENLIPLLEKHGFKDIKEWNVDLDIINPKRKWGTLYLIAKK